MELAAGEGGSPRAGSDRGVIDHPDQVGRLMDRMNEALPIPARVTPELHTMLRRQHGTELPASCRVTWISYAGDEGGIMCRLDAGPADGQVVTSITHLRFDPRLPLARDIAAYQKHRVKQLRRQSA